MQDTSRQDIDIRRVKLHEDIDAAQHRFFALDGKDDGMTSLSRDSAINDLLFDIYGRQVDVLQNAIEQRETSDHRIKVKYLTGLKQLLEGLQSALVRGEMSPDVSMMLVDAYQYMMQTDIVGGDISGQVNYYPYAVNQLLLGSNTVFFENSGLKTSRLILFRQFASLFPDKVLSRIEPYIDQPFADSMLVASAYHYTADFYNYASASGTPVGKKIQALKDPLVQQIVRITHENAGRLIFPFLTAIMKGSITVDSIKSIIPQPYKYFKQLVQTQLQYLDDATAKDTPLVYHEMFNTIRRKSEEVFINNLNALHDAPDEIRFKAIQSLSSEELYYVLVSGEDLLYTSSFTGMYARMMAKAPKVWILMMQ
jgi:hypothetical protein